MKLLPLVNAKAPLSRQAVYRFFNQTEDVGVAIALHSLADTVATFGDSLTPEKWQTAVGVTRQLFAAWWEGKEVLISPRLLLDGNDLQEAFGLKPSKQIGVLLEALREAQAVGEVTSLEEAKAFIHAKINQTVKG